MKEIKFFLHILLCIACVTFLIGFFTSNTVAVVFSLISIIFSLLGIFYKSK